MKKLGIIAVMTGVLTSISIICSFNTAEEALSQGVIRLHIRANSNTDEDQSLKLKVRDRILKEAGSLFKETEDVSMAKSKAQDNLSYIEKTACDEILKNGYNYPVKVTLGKSRFPTKMYDDICLPAGTYEALIVTIGEGKGDNWWCVMFPPLCFAKETYTADANASKEAFEKNIGEEGYELISEGGIKFKFKLYELWQKLSNKN